LHIQQTLIFIEGLGGIGTHSGVHRANRVTKADDETIISRIDTAASPGDVTGVRALDMTDGFGAAARSANARHLPQLCLGVEHDKLLQGIVDRVAHTAVYVDLLSGAPYPLSVDGNALRT
jgi:hypothetical protein